MNLVKIDIGKPSPRNPPGWGNDNDGWLCTAIVNQTYKPVLSENSVSFWCYLDKYGIDLRIARQSPEGQKVERGIRVNISLLQMEKLLLALVLPYMKPHQFEQIVEQVEQDAFIRGKNAVRQSLAAVLKIE